MTIDSSTQASLLTVVFEYGTTTGVDALRFCDAEETTELDLSSGPWIGNFNYTPDPLLSFTSPERSGGIEEDDGELITSSEWGFVHDASVGRAFAPIKVSVVEYIFPGQTAASFSAQTLYHFIGSATVVEVNPDGEAGTVKWTLLNAKHRTGKQLDSLALEKCRNDFGSGKVCMFNLLNARENARITAISGTSVTIDNFSIQPPGWWVDGHVQYDGTFVKIRSWDNANGFVLQQPPPVSWVEGILLDPLDVVIAPGCDKTDNDCARYEQRDMFRGLGIDIPEHHPVFEKPVFVS